MGFVGNLGAKKEVCKSPSIMSPHLISYKQVARVNLHPSRANDSLAGWTQEQISFTVSFLPWVLFSPCNQTPSVSCGNICPICSRIHHGCQMKHQGSHTHIVQPMVFCVIQHMTNVSLRVLKELKAFRCLFINTHITRSASHFISHSDHW